MSNISTIFYKIIDDSPTSEEENILICILSCCLMDTIVQQQAHFICTVTWIEMLTAGD